MGIICNIGKKMNYCLQLIILYIKAGGNTVAKNQKSDTTTILGAFRLYEILPDLKSPQQQIDGILPKNPKKDAIFVEKSLGPQTESPWFLIPSKIFYLSLNNYFSIS